MEQYSTANVNAARLRHSSETLVANQSEGRNHRVRQNRRSQWKVMNPSSFLRTDEVHSANECNEHSDSLYIYVSILERVQFSELPNMLIFVIYRNRESSVILCADSVE